MKTLLALLVSAFASEAWACVDISGLYTLGDGIYLRYSQERCETLTRTWCYNYGKNCPGSNGFTWKLDGSVNQSGGNPANWAKIVVDGDKLHWTSLWDQGARYEGRQCWWTEAWYSKDAHGNLIVSTPLKCLDGTGKYDTQVIDTTWMRVE